LRLRANVQELIEEDGVVRGVRYRDETSKWCDVRAALTVGADGRHSTVRRLAGIVPRETSTPMDILWLRVPRQPGDVELEQGLRVVFGTGHFCVLLERPGREWQIGYVMVKGTFAQLRAEGIASFRANLTALLPEFADRVAAIEDFKHVSVLAAGSNFCLQWWKPGLLLIGDAAHVMSPVAGIGILHAIQDAVAAANVLSEPLRAGRVADEHLAAVQKRRQFAVKAAQMLQQFIHRRVIAPALAPNRSDTLPWYLRWFFRTRPLGNRPSVWLAHGILPPRWISPAEGA
jgi:2-polyprenyl-6-methoxyphenol hydroxylase-like FAD-dependent oxidoreductase